MEKAKLKMDKYTLLDENQKKIFMLEREREFIFKFDTDEFNDGMRILKQKMHHIMPCPPDIEDIEKEIEIEMKVTRFKFMRYAIRLRWMAYLCE